MLNPAAQLGRKQDYVLEWKKKIDDSSVRAQQECMGGACGLCTACCGSGARRFQSSLLSICKYFSLLSICKSHFYKGYKAKCLVGWEGRGRLFILTIYFYVGMFGNTLVMCG